MRFRPKYLSIHIARNNDEITFHAEANDNIKTGKICIFVHPGTGPRLIGGSPTFSFVPSDLMIGVDLSCIHPTALAWFPCVYASAYDIPIANPPKAPVQLSLPVLTLFDQTKNGFALPRCFRAFSDFHLIKKIVIVGKPQEVFFSDLVKSKKYATIAVISDSQQHLSRILKHLDAKARLPIANKSIWITVDKTRVAILWLPKLSTSQSLIENFFIEIMKRCSNDWMLKEPLNVSNYHQKRRLRPIPYCNDLSIGMISILGNIYREKLPDLTKFSLNYDIYRNNSFWLVPCEGFSIERSKLIEELNIRIVSEHIASRAYSELMSIRQGSTNKLKHKISQRTACKLFDFWRRYSGLSQTELLALERITCTIQVKSTKSQQLLFKSLAIAAYQACSQKGYFFKSNPRSEGLAYVNSLIVVYATGSDNAYDLNLQFCSNFWAFYAGRTRSIKPAAIVASFLHNDETEEIKTLQNELRQLLQNRILPDIQIYRIQIARENLSKKLTETIEPATYSLMRKLNPDRIIVFSNFALENLQCNGTILCLEYPVARYPASLPTAYSAGLRSAIASFSRIYCFAPNKAAVLVARNIIDEITKWAIGISDELKATLSLIGCDVCFPFEDYKDKKAALKKLEGTQIVIFIGHGRASLDSAELLLGDFTISIDELRKIDWSNLFVLLIGCETAAIDSKNGDIASTLLELVQEQ